MSNSALKKVADEVAIFAKTLLDRPSAAARGFLNFNPTFYAMTDSAIDAGLLLEGSAILRDIRKFHIKGLRQYKKELSEAKTLKQQAAAQDKLETTLAVLQRTGLYRTKTRPFKDLNLKTVEELSPRDFDIVKLEETAKVWLRAEYRAAILRQLKNKPRTTAQLRWASRRVVSHLGEQTKKFHTEFDQSIADAETKEAATVALLKSSSASKASFGPFTGNKELLNVVNGYAKDEAILKNKISRKFLLYLTGKKSSEKTELIPITDNKGTLIGILGLSASAFGREDYSSGFREIRNTIGAATKELKVIVNSKSDEVGFEALKLLNIRAAVGASGQEQSVVDQGHVGLSSVIGKSISRIAEKIDHDLISVPHEPGEESATAELVSGLNSIIAEIEKAHAAFSASLVSVGISKGTSADSEAQIFAGIESIVVTIGQNAAINQSIIGADVESKVKIKVQEVLARYGTQLGSPSVLSIIEQSLVATLLGKTYKVEHKSQARSKTYKSKAQKIKVGKVQKPPNIKQALGGKMMPELGEGKPRSNVTVPDISWLVAYLNKELPPIIKRNMTSPKLVYRTGRFANSVRVLTATRSITGEIVFRYTYQKDPYQTFEPGNKMGSTKRDPRPLIAGSIRELVTPIVKQRFRSVRV